MGSAISGPQLTLEPAGVCCCGGLDWIVSFPESDYGIYKTAVLARRSPFDFDSCRFGCAGDESPSFWCQKKQEISQAASRKSATPSL
ncbi:UNVERIFIED_CONTAM: hypothetical protein K2H54_040089 [Gekko kuhli]